MWNWCEQDANVRSSACVRCMIIGLIQCPGDCFYCPLFVQCTHSWDYTYVIASIARLGVNITPNLESFILWT